MTKFDYNLQSHLYYYDYAYKLQIYYNINFINLLFKFIFAVALSD